MIIDSEVAVLPNNDSPGVRVLRTLRAWIGDGRLPVGESLPPENVVAVQLGVARATLRVALKRLEDEGLLQTRGRRRIVSGPPKSQESKLVTQTVALLVDPPGWVGASRQTGWERYIQVGISDAVRAAGMHCLMLQADLVAGDQVHRLIAERPRGAIALRHAMESAAGREIILACQRAGIATVGYGHAHEMSEFDTVASDHCSGAYQLARWLLSRGRKNILRYWHGAWPIGTRPAWLAQRDSGFERAHAEASLPAIAAVEPPPKVWDSEATFDERVRFVAGYLAEYLMRSNVDSIMVTSDGLVPFVAAACRLLGKIPNRDIDLVGYDNYWIDVAERSHENTAPLATMDKGNIGIGHALVDLLTSRLAGTSPPEPQHRLVEPRLISLEPSAAQ